MKTCVMILLILCFSVVAMAQVVAIQCDSQMVVHVGVPNPIRIAIEGYPCSQLMVTMDSGTVEGKNGAYAIIPTVPSGDLAIHVKVKTVTGFNEVAQKHIRAECIVVKQGNILGKIGGFIAADDMKRAITIQAPVPYSSGEACGNVNVFSFIVTVLREGNVILNKTILTDTGVRFSDNSQVGKMLQSLRANDRVKFTNIRYRGPGGHICDGKLNDMDFTITR